MSSQDKSCDGNNCSYLAIETGGFSMFLMSSQYTFLEQAGKIKYRDSLALGKLFGMFFKKLFHANGKESKTLIRTKDSAQVTF